MSGVQRAPMVPNVCATGHFGVACLGIHSPYTHQSNIAIDCYYNSYYYYHSYIKIGAAPMNLHVPDYLFSFIDVASLSLVVGVLSLIWLATIRMESRWRERVGTAGILSFALLGWYAAAYYIGWQNVFWAPDDTAVPIILLGILCPIIIGLLFLSRSEGFARLLDALPLSWLVGIQVYRVLGFMFLVLWWGGHLPWQFALPAGIGDIAVGVFAAVAACMLIVNASYSHSAAYAWCLFGIADLVVAVTMGALTSPGIIHFMALDAPNMLITAYPLVMIPIFAVPVSIILHGLCLWKLRRFHADVRTSEAVRA